MECLVPFVRAGQHRKILEGADGWPHVPALLVNISNFEDVVKVGCLCLAQLVNVIAPIITVPGSPAWRVSRPTIPISSATRYGRGAALQLTLDCPGCATGFSQEVSYPGISVVETEPDGALTIFIVNRHQSESIVLALEGSGTRSVSMDKVTEGHGLRASNGLKASLSRPATALVPKKPAGISRQRSRL